jgi:hypothetical protein
MKSTRVAAVAAIVIAAGAASAAEFVFFANLSGLNEVPANNSPALGFMAGVYDDVANTFSFSWVITDNLLGAPALPGAQGASPDSQSFSSSRLSRSVSMHCQKPGCR